MALSIRIASMTEAAAAPSAPNSEDSTNVKGVPATALPNMIRLIMSSISKTNIVCVPSTLITPKRTGKGESNCRTRTESSKDGPKNRWQIGRANTSVESEVHREREPIESKLLRIILRADVVDVTLKAVMCGYRACVRGLSKEVAALMSLSAAL